MAATTCLACGKTGHLLRCARCKSVRFCNRDCQVVAARMGHSGANCRPAKETQAHTAADAVASRLPEVPGSSTTGLNHSDSNCRPAEVPRLPDAA